MPGRTGNRPREKGHRAGRMTNITLIAQDVNGDPYLAGGNINIINNRLTVLTFVDVDHTLNDPLTGEYVSLDGGVTLLSYQYLGNGNVRGDPMQNASFIRIDLGDGSYLTVALDMNADFDDVPDLRNGNTQLTMETLDRVTPNWFPGFACFRAGTLIDTDRGPRPVQALRPGDGILTADHGVQPLLHLSVSRVRAEGALAPVRFAPGVLGNRRPLWVSQQHKMLIAGWRAELYCGAEEVLVPAIRLVDGDRVRVIEGGPVRYHHLLLPRHEIVFADGVPSESYDPAAARTGGAAARAEARALCPDLDRGGCQAAADAGPAMAGAMARAVARGAEARMLLAA